MKGDGRQTGSSKLSPTKNSRRGPYRKAKFLYKYRKPITGEGIKKEKLHLREVAERNAYFCSQQTQQEAANNVVYVSLQKYEKMDSDSCIRGVEEGIPHKVRPLERMRWHKITRDDEIGYFAPLTWEFWRCLIVCFCLMCIVGHWLEMPYCMFMDYFFGIVSDDYAVWTDPWYHPYWVYGFGAVVMTLIIEPLKEMMVLRRKTLWGALLETFVLMTLLAMILELVIGLMVNQPDATGHYPYWDNSELPLNVFGQAWLVNDAIIALAAMAYVWIIYPLVNELFMFLRPNFGNALFVIVVVGFAICCTVSYIQIFAT